MVKFQTKMDPLGKIYIAKPLRRSGLINTIEIVPNSKCAVIYQAGTKTKDVISSLEVIMADLRNRLRMEAEEA